jgi:aspartyl-tRNA(Asn)/glutamyl-tRNA(Gln) amidotransferase subunit A
MDGVYPLAATLDTLGVLCRTTEDAILIDAAMRGLVAPYLRHVAIEGLRIIVPQNVVLDDCEPAVLANFEAAIERLGEAGATVERTTLAALDEIMALNARHGTIVAAEAYALHKERVEGAAAALMDRRVAMRIARGASVTARDYICILQARRRLIAEVAMTIQGRCLVAYPTVAHTAPSIAALEADDELFTRVNMKTLRNTMFGNFLDWCGVSIPTGVDAAGLPTAVLLSGAPGGDDHLLASSLAAEPWVRGEAA